VQPHLATALAWVPVVALVVLLATAVGHPRGRVEAAIGVVAAGATLAVGGLDWAGLRDVVEHLGPVVLFLVTILVVGDVCAKAGVFVRASRVVARWGGGRAVALLTGVFLLGALVTIVLSLDATVVLLMPVVVGAAIASGVSPWPHAHTSLRMANSASLLLPVSNLTNLLALHHLRLSFAGFAAAMAPVLAVVLLVEYAALRWLFRADLRAPEEEPEEVEPVTSARFPVVVVTVMLVGFVVAGQLDCHPFWVSTAAAVVLVVWARARGLVGARDVLGAAHPGFAVLVMALGVVVAALADGLLGDVVRDLLPGSTSYAGLLMISVIATVLSALVTNLSATLLLVPMLEPLGTVAVLAALLGLNIGSGLTWTGSLANLLWRRGLLRLGMSPTTRDFHRVSLVITPLSLVAGVTVLALLH
jgi:arsenical pump membrane protein